MAKKQVKTIDLKGKQYAQVKDRLKEFRSVNPRARIETTPSVQEDGSILFKAYILSDKANEHSADATGHALGKAGNEKAFEKLETIAVGRALALLGYATDGEIASSEEMEEFEAQRAAKQEATVQEWTEKITKAKSLDALKKVWASVPAELKQQLEKTKDEIKKRYADA